MQKAFVQYVKNKFKTLDSVNKAFGLNYWSNRINNWNDFPSTVGSINASLNAEFAKFQHQLVTHYLAWQSKIVKEYAKPNQFVTQNFDFEWRGFSYGIQSDVDHFAAGKALDIAGVDIYHPTQDNLTGIEISFGGDMARSMKAGKNYLVIETQAQGLQSWYRSLVRRSKKSVDRLLCHLSKCRRKIVWKESCYKWSYGWQKWRCCLGKRK